MDKLDVSIKYYPETSKGHSVGAIVFRNSLGEIIEHSRVELVMDAEALYFSRPSEGREGIRLNNSKIQLWSLAWIAKDWEGEYPLKYDMEKGCYKVMRCDKQEEEKEEGKRLGTSVQYVPHKKEVTPVKPVKEVEKILLNTLFDTLLNSEDIVEIKAIARTIKVLVNGGKGEG